MSNRFYVLIAAALLSCTNIASQAANAHGNGHVNPHHNPHHNPHRVPTEVPYVCDKNSPSELISQFVNAGSRRHLIYEFDGNGARGDNSFEYGCDFAGIVINNVAGLPFTSISYELTPQSECNNAIGPNLYVNYNLNGSLAGTLRVICNEAFLTGVTSEGFGIYEFPASTFDIGPSATINSIAVAFFPGSTPPDPAVDYGPAMIDNFKINGSPVALNTRSGTLQTCPQSVVEFERTKGFACPQN